MWAQYKNYRLREIQKKLDTMNAYPLDVLVVGASGVGKSSTLNTFFQKETARVGFGAKLETEEISSYNLNSLCRLWDTPGLGYSREKDKIYIEEIRNALNQCYGNARQYGIIDLVLLIMTGGSKDIGVPVKLLREVIFPNIQEDRVLIAVNKADLSKSGRHWNYEQNRPDAVLEKYLDDQMRSVHSRLQQDLQKWKVPYPIYYSALHDYHVYKLYDLLIDHIPTDRRRV